MVTYMNEGEILSENTSSIFIRGELAHFKERLKEAMNGESNRVFGARCQLSEAVIRNYLSGKSYPSLERLALIAQATGKPVAWFLTDGSTVAANLYAQPTQIDEKALKEKLLSILNLMNTDELNTAINVFKVKGLAGLMPDVLGQAFDNAASKEILQQRVQPERAQAAGHDVGPQNGKKKAG